MLAHVIACKKTWLIWVGWPISLFSVHEEFTVSGTQCHHASRARNVELKVYMHVNTLTKKRSCMSSFVLMCDKARVTLIGNRIVVIFVIFHQYWSLYMCVDFDKFGWKSEFLLCFHHSAEELWIVVCFHSACSSSIPGRTLHWKRQTLLLICWTPRLPSHPTGKLKQDRKTYFSSSFLFLCFVLSALLP